MPAPPQKVTSHVVKLTPEQIGQFRAILEKAGWTFSELPYAHWKAQKEHTSVAAYHSGKIENERITYNDTREIFEHDGVTSYTGDLRTLFEIRNAKARELRLHFVWKREDSLLRVVERLNNFEAVNIAVEDNKIIVK